MACLTRQYQSSLGICVVDLNRLAIHCVDAVEINVSNERKTEVLTMLDHQIERMYIHISRLVRARSGHVLAKRRNADEVDTANNVRSGTTREKRWSKRTGA